MKLIAWNVQRWGATTSPGRVASIESVNKAESPDLVLYTELTSANQHLAAFNPTFRKRNSAQLCYGAVRQNGGDVWFKRLDTVAPTPAYWDCGYTVGTFRNVLDRGPALVMRDGTEDFEGYADWDGTRIVLLHAPASKAAVRAVIFLTTWLESTDGDYVLVGDLNAEPGAIKEVVSGTDATILQNRLRYALTGTHERGRRYDYVFARFEDTRRLTVRTAGSGGTFAASDHVPIVVEWSNDRPRKRRRVG
ncbi:MAG TPA: hypothetical protein VF519_00605 [Mycobacteriales bacterium]|jgi:hypothetical protein